MPPRARPWRAIFAIMTKVGAYIVLRLWLLLFGDGAGASAQFGGEWLLLGGMATVAFGAIGTLGFAGHGAARRLFGARVLRNGARRHRNGAGRRHGRGAVLPGQLDARPRRLLPPGRACRAGPRARGGRARRDAGGLRRGDEVDDEDEVGIAIPATMGMLGLAFIGCALVIAGLPPLSGFIAKFALLTAALNPPGGASRRRPALGLARRPDPVRTGGAHRHDARRHSRLLGFAGPGRAARAADRDGAGRRASAPVRGPDDPGRPGHALHAGDGAVAARPSRLRPRRPRSAGRQPRADMGPT